MNFTVVDVAFEWIFFFVDRIALLRRAVIRANEQPKKKEN